MRFVRWLQAQWFPAEKTHRSFWIAVFFLWPLQLLFIGISSLRRFAYQRGWLTVHRLPVPVVVVGNITVGGAGKTPLTLWLAEQFIIRGIKPGIISRGYGAHLNRGDSAENALPVYPDSSPDRVGDEPVLLASRSHCPVWVAPRRVDAALGLLAAHPETELLICDDGLQHFGLGRDVEVVVFDARGVGNGWRLPLGPLREPLTRLHSVDALVLNGSVPRLLSDRLPDVPIFTMSLQPGTFYRLGDPQSHCSAADLLGSGKLLHAVAGIGYPSRFFATLKSLGLQCVEHPFSDHHAYVAEDLRFGENGILLLTEKDAVKCTSFYRGEAWVLPVEAHIPSALAEILLEKINGHAST